MASPEAKIFYAYYIIIVGLARGQKFLCLFLRGNSPEKPHLMMLNREFYRDMPRKKEAFFSAKASYVAESRLFSAQDAESRLHLAPYVAESRLFLGHDQIAIWSNTKNALFLLNFGAKIQHLVQNSAFSPKFSMLNFLNSDFGFCTS